MAFMMGNNSKKISHITERLFHTNTGCTIISALFGVALAFMFQRVCKGSQCLIVKSPPPADIDDYVFQNGDVCYEYKPKIVECDS